MFRFPQNIAARPVGDRLIIMDLQGNAYYSLNESASFMLNSLLSGKTIEQTVDATLSEFDADRPMAEADLQELLNDLKSMHLIEECP